MWHGRLLFIALVLSMSMPGCSLFQYPGGPYWATREPPRGEYRKVSELVHFPEYYPGLGTLYVQPRTLPYGPFRAYDRRGKLVATIYMVPMKDLEAHAMKSVVEGAPESVDHVDFHFNNGHPGVEVPHYHVILWHVSSEEAGRL